MAMIGVHSEPVDVAELAVAIRRGCRSQGLEVSASTAIELHEALRFMPELGPHGIYYASRALCVHRPEDRPAFDRAFTELFGRTEGLDDGLPGISAPTREMPAPDAGKGLEVSVGARVGAYSREEALLDRDISTCSPAELEMIASVLAQVLRRQARTLRRRTHVGSGTSRRPDLRRSIIHARSTQGEMVELRFRTRRPAARRVVFLLDVSGSMETYTPAFLRLVYGTSREVMRVEVFSLGTRLTRLTRALSGASVEGALEEVGQLVRDWSGGTRLGETLGIFNDLFGVRGLARGATVVVVSDGLDRGDPELLARQMQRLHFVARQVIWVNPLKAADRYQPLARGMTAALSEVDHFISGHSLASLSELVELICTGAAGARSAPRLAG